VTFPDDLSPFEVSLQESGEPDKEINSSAILKSLGEVVYEWDIKTDSLTWGPGVKSILNIRDSDLIKTGKGFASLLDSENVSNRYDVVMGSCQSDTGTGVPYELQYRLCTGESEKNRKLWIEDCGRWFGGRQGKPEKAHGIVRVVDERVEREQRLSYLSRFDELTGLLNRSRLIEVLYEVISDAKSFHRTYAMTILSIDNLKIINDAYGYDIADQIIASVSHKAKSVMRQGDAIGRLSGNKIGLILMNCGPEDFSHAAERIIQHVSDSIIDTPTGTVAVTISLGGVIVPSQAHTTHQALSYAHEALNEARKCGNSSFNLYQRDIDRDRRRKDNIDLAEDIISALNDRRFSLAFQPIADCKTRKTAFEEALLRMTDRHGALVAAGRFIPRAEEIGLIRLLDQRTLELVLKTLQNVEDITLSLNVSSDTIHERTWYDLFSSTLSINPSIGERLIVEITESMALKNLEKTCEFIDSIRRLGAKVAIDDFGAGYTSFRNLKNLDVDMVKIDGAFVKNMHNDKKDQVFVKALVELASTFSAKTVAEWVTSEETADMLQDMGVDFIQGEVHGLPDMSPSWLPDKQNPDEKEAGYQEEQKTG
jgi:diguanylate cyclase (GGDEF)-like protein